jgi:hypothetical protein
MADNLDQITSFLLGKGLTREQVAGIAGNLKIESGYSPTAYNANENAIGIAQWQGGRRSRLQAYAAQMGGKETDLSVQLGFLWQELQGSENHALTQLATTTTPATAAAAFDQYFERSSGAARQARIAAANTLYPSIGPSAGQPGYTWDPTTGYANGNGQPFRSQGAAFTTGVGGDGTPPSTADLFGRGLLDGLLGGLFGPSAVQNKDSAAAIAGNIVKFATIALFLVGGVALVVGGLVTAAKPAVSKAIQTVGELK